MSSESAPVPFAPWFAYGVGNVACTIAAFGISILAPYVFTLQLGVSPALVGLALSLPRFVDLFADPIAGYASDRGGATNRRRRFIAAGALLSASSFAATWWFPPGLSTAGYFGWLLIFGCLCFVGYSIMAVPLQALAYEMTADGYQRTRLMAISLILGSATGIGLGWVYAETKLPCFGTVTDGARWVGTGLAAATLASGMVAAVFCRERRASGIARRGEPRGHSLLDMWRSTRWVLGSGPLRVLLLSLGCLSAGIFSVNSLTPFLAIDFVRPGDAAKASVLIGAAATAWQLTCVLLTTPITWISQRRGKRATLLGFLGFGLVGAVSQWGCYDPAEPWLYVVPSICLAASCAAAWTLAPSMMAEICDLEEARTGRRESGIFAACYLWTIKLGSSLGLAIGGLLLSATGFKSSPGAVQSAAVVWRMRLVDSVFPTLAIVAAMVLLSRDSSKGAARISPRGQIVGLL